MRWTTISAPSRHTGDLFATLPFACNLGTGNASDAWAAKKGSAAWQLRHQPRPYQRTQRICVTSHVLSSDELQSFRYPGSV